MTEFDVFCMEQGQKKREALVRGYEGQIRYLHKRIEKNARIKARRRRPKRDPDKDTARCY